MVRDGNYTRFNLLRHRTLRGLLNLTRAILSVVIGLIVCPLRNKKYPTTGNRGGSRIGVLRVNLLCLFGRSDSDEEPDSARKEKSVRF